MNSGSVLSINQELTLTIVRLGIYGEGVGHWCGITIFVEGALPTEQILCAVYEIRRNFGRARLIKILKVSCFRQKPICPVFGRCGGCQIMHLKYTEQLKIKKDRVIDALERIGKLSTPLVSDCEPSPADLYYRNKIQVLAGIKNQKTFFGLYALHSHQLVEVHHCYIHCSLGEKAFELTLELTEQTPILNLRCLIIKTAVIAQQIIVIFVTKDSNPVPSNIIVCLKNQIPEIKGILQNIQPKDSNTIVGQEYRLLYGDSFMEDTVKGLRCRISAASFFQVNSYQIENLYDKVLEFAELLGNEIVLDGYCGIGVLSMLLAQKAYHVIGVESNPYAIEDARENAKMNQIKNIEFFVAATEIFIQSLQNIDVVILNPPRKGCERSVLEKLLILKPKRIIYISCDPATLARDLQVLTCNAYSLNEIQPFDMFPQTMHVETVAKLSLAH